MKMSDEKGEKREEKILESYEKFVAAFDTAEEETAFNELWDAYVGLTGGKYFHDKVSKENAHLSERSRKRIAIQTWALDMIKKYTE